jgi:hypothetical protein
MGYEFLQTSQVGLGVFEGGGLKYEGLVDTNFLISSDIQGRFRGWGLGAET